MTSSEVRNLNTQRAPSTARARDDGTPVMVAGTIAATVGAYLFQMVAAHVLGPVGVAPVIVLWTVQVLVLSVLLVPVEHYTIYRLDVLPGHMARLQGGGVVGGLVAAGALAAVAFAVVTRQQYFAGDAAFAPLAGLLVLGYAAFAFARGHLAGDRRYRAYGWATAAESGLRLALTAAILTVSVNSSSVAWAMVIAPLAVLAWRPFRDRPPAAAPDTHDLPSAGRFLGPLVFGNACSQTMLAAGPLVMGALGAEASAISVLFVTFALFRGPLWMLQSLLARVLPPFTVLAARGEHAVLRAWALRLLVTGALLSVVAWVAGAQMGADVVQLLFGADFRPGPQVAALASAGAALAGTALVTNQILVALGQTGRLAAAWMIALLLATAVLVGVSGPPDIRVATGFVTGEAIALVAVTAAVVRSTRRVEVAQ